MRGAVDPVLGELVLAPALAVALLLVLQLMPPPLLLLLLLWCVWCSAMAARGARRRPAARRRLRTTRLPTNPTHPAPPCPSPPPAALALAGQQAGKEGHPEATAEAGPWLLTLDFPSYFPVMTHAKNR